jgi:hypothetical protein
VPDLMNSIQHLFGSESVTIKFPVFVKTGVID